MSVFQNVLKTTMEGDQNDLIFKKFIMRELNEKKKLPAPFHIDCRITKKRICYCPYFEGNLMPEKEKKNFQVLAHYLNNYFTGIKDQDYKALIRKKFFVEEKIKYCQEIEDVLYYMPKYHELCTQKNEIPFEKKEDTLNKYGIPEECFYCKTKISPEFFYVRSDNTNAPICVCSECNMKLTTATMPMKPIKPVSSHKSKLKNSNPHIHKTMLGKRKPISTVWQNKHSYSHLKEKKLNVLPSTKRICCWNNCNKSTNSEDFIICKKCDRSFHASCSDPPLFKSLVDRFPWFCNECKLCTICQRTTEEDELLICDCCDRAFHLGCLVPKRTEIPEGKWYCSDCHFCACCKQKNFETLENAEEMDKASKRRDEKFKEILFCESCFAFVKNKQVCPICWQVIPEDSGGSFIYCDSCGLWCHSECEKISKGKFKEIKSLNPYICTRCKDKEKQNVPIKK